MCFNSRYEPAMLRPQPDMLPLSYRTLTQTLNATTELHWSYILLVRATWLNYTDLYFTCYHWATLVLLFNCYHWATLILLFTCNHWATLISTVRYLWATLISHFMCYHWATLISTLHATFELHWYLLYVLPLNYTDLILYVLPLSYTYPSTLRATIELHWSYYLRAAI